MPVYVYRCQGCGDVFERRQSFSDSPLTTHDGCGGSVQRVLQPAAVVFKGSGWYITDSRNRSNGSAKSEADGAGSSEASTSSSTSSASESSAKKSS